MRVRLTSVAETELKEAMESYEAAQEGLGAKFLAEVRAATKLVETHPLAWTLLSSRTRRIHAHRFPFGLFYQVRPDEIWSCPHGFATRSETLGQCLGHVCSESRPTYFFAAGDANVVNRVRNFFFSAFVMPKSLRLMAKLARTTSKSPLMFGTR